MADGSGGPDLSNLNIDSGALPPGGASTASGEPAVGDHITEQAINSQTMPASFQPQVPSGTYGTDLPTYMQGLPRPTDYSNLIDAVTEQEKEATRVGQRSYNVNQNLGYGIAGVIGAGIDTLGRSVGLLDPGQMSGMIGKVISGDAKDFYDQHYAGLSLIGDIATAFIPGAIGAKLAEGGGLLYKAVQAEKLPFLQNIFTSGAKMGAAMDSLYETDKLQVGAKWSISQVMNNPDRAAAAAQIIKTGATDSLKKFIAGEALTYVTMHSSDNLYPEDMDLSGQLALHATVGGVMVGAETLFLRAAIRRSLLRPELAAATKAVQNPTAVDDVFGSTNNRDFGLVKSAVSSNMSKNVAQQAGSDIKLKQNAQNMQAGWDSEIKNTTEAIASDGLPGLATKSANNASSIQTVTRSVTADPTIGIGLTGFKPLATTLEGSAADQDLVTVTMQGYQDTANNLIQRYAGIQNSLTKVRQVKRGLTPTVARTALLDTADQIIGNVDTLSPTALKGLQDQLQTLRGQVSSNLSNGKIDTTIQRKLKLASQATDTWQSLLDTNAKIESIKDITSSVITPEGDIVSAGTKKFGFVDQGSNAPGIKTIAPGSKTQESIFGYNTVNAILTAPDGGRFKPAISSLLDPIYANGQTWNDLTYYQKDAYYALGQQVIDHPTIQNPIFGPTQKIQILPTTDAFKVDLVRGMLQKNPSFIKNIQLPTNVEADQLPAWLERQSLIKKYNDVYVPMRAQMDASGSSVLKMPSGQQTTIQDVAHAMNMPNSFMGTESPVMRVFNQLYMQGDRDFEAAVPSADQFQTMMKQTIQADPNAMKAPNDLLAFMRAKIPTSGSLLDRPMDSNGNFLPSVLGFYKPQPWSITESSMQTYAAAQKSEFTTKLMSAPADIRDLMQNLLTSNTRKVALDSASTFIDGMQANRGLLSYQNFATRGIDGFTALDAQSKLAENWGYKKVEQVLGKDHAVTWAALRDKENEGSLFGMANWVHSRRFGFELESTTEADAKGNMTFPLKTNDEGDLTKRNVDAINRFFQGNLPEGISLDDITHMPMQNPDNKAYIPMALDPLAFKGISAIRDNGDRLLKVANFFRNLYGKPEIAYQDWHIPAKNFQGKFTKFIVIPTEGGGRPVKQILTGNTASELQKQFDSPAVQQIFKDNPAATAYDYRSIENYYDLHDEAFHNMVDMSDPLGQTGGMTGAAGSPMLQYGNRVLDDLVQSIEKQWIVASKRTLAASFDTEMRKWNMLDKVWQDQPRSGLDKSAPSIWQQATDHLLGVSTLKSSNSPLAIEAKNDSNLVNGIMSKVIDNLRAFVPKVTDKFAASSPGTQKDFDSLRKAFGGNLPYSDAAEFAANTFKIGKAPDAEKVVHTLNAVTANLIMRIADVGNGVISVLGNMVSMPLVMNAMTRSNYPSDAAFDAAGSIFGGTKVGADFIAPNPVRWMAKSISTLFTDEGKQVMQEGMARGNIKPTQIAAYEALHRPFESSYQTSVNKLVNFVSYPSDKGEMTARNWAYMGGYLLGRDGYGIGDANNLHSFADYFADQVIANYRPSNKPLMFQGLFGSPLGLFQTYMFNYYQRMFKYIENKDYRSLTVNYALQGSLFGMQSVPGFKQMNDMYTWAHDEKSDIIDSMDARYGRTATDGIMYGAISNLPKLFGQDGIALYSRADTNLSKVPAFISPTNAPIISMMNSAWNMASSVIDQARQGGQWSTKRTLETIGAYSINRPLGRLLELATGVSADQRGNLINTDTRNGLSMAARAMAMRPMAETENMQAYNRVASHAAYQEAVMERVDSGLRAIINSNPSEDELDKAFSKGIMSYLKAGGNPAGVGEFVRNTYLSAVLTKNEKAALGLLRNPGRTQDGLRLLSNMQDYQNGPGEQPPGAAR